MTYIPLNVHSQFSILDSTASVTALAEKAKSYSIPSLALTDQGNLYGAVDFYKACKAAGVKPILGCEIWMAPGSRLEKKKVRRRSEWISDCSSCEKRSKGIGTYANSPRSDFWKAFTISRGSIKRSWKPTAKG